MLQQFDVYPTLDPKNYVGTLHGFLKYYTNLTEDVLQRNDELMMSTSEYWGNLVGLDELDYVNDEFLDNDFLQAIKERITVSKFLVKYFMAFSI